MSILEEYQAWLASHKTRFMKSVFIDPNSGCWIWTGREDDGGYGVFTLDKKRKKAHRVSYELFVGVISNTICVLHKCDVRLCVNPKHLFLGTRGDNMEDAITKRRFNHKGRNNPSAVLVENDVKEIKRNENNETQEELAKKYGVTQSTVSHIKTGRTWSYLDDKLV